MATKLVRIIDIDRRWYIATEDAVGEAVVELAVAGPIATREEAVVELARARARLAEQTPPTVPI